MRALLIGIIKSFIEKSDLSHPLSIIANDILEISIAPDLLDATKEVIKVHCADAAKAQTLSQNLASQIVRPAPIENNTMVIISEAKADYIFREPQLSKLSLKEFKTAVKKRQLAKQLKDFIQKLIQNPIGNANINGNNAISSIDIVDDLDQITRPGAQVLKIIFKTQKDANLFSEWAGRAKVIDTSTTASSSSSTSSHTSYEAIVGSSRAPVVFNNLFGTLNNSGYYYSVATKNALDQKIQHEILQDVKNGFLSMANNQQNISEIVKIDKGVDALAQNYLRITFNDSYKAKIFANFINVTIPQNQLYVQIDKSVSCRILSFLFPDKNALACFNYLFGIINQPPVVVAMSPTVPMPAVATTSSTNSVVDEAINFDSQVFIQDILVQGNGGETQQAYILHPFLGACPVIQIEDARLLPPTQHPSTRAYYIINNIIQLINTAKATHEQYNCHHEKFSNCITRLITDEFSFYTRSWPLNIEEYKQIINGIFDYINKKTNFPPNIHLILSSFPVLWADNTVHNSVLYVESNKSKLNIYHFSKLNSSYVDFAYSYNNCQLGTDNHLLPDHPYSPETVLAGSKITFDRTHQCGGAFKFFTKGDRAFITTVGICLDHVAGIERQQCKQLFKQLYLNNQAIPLQISHVVSSYTTRKFPLNELAPIVHADCNSLYRIENMPQDNHSYMGTSFIPPTYSAEYYKFKPLTLFYGEMLDEIARYNTSSISLSNRLNFFDKEGNTILHRILKDPFYSYSPYSGGILNLYYKYLQRKLIIDLLQKGANPYIPNKQGETAFSLANNIYWLNNLIPPPPRLLASSAPQPAQITQPPAVLLSNTGKRPLPAVVTDCSTSNNNYYPPAKRIMC